MLEQRSPGACLQVAHAPLLAHQVPPEPEAPKELWSIDKGSTER